MLIQLIQYSNLSLSRFDLPTPIYVNMVRDPVERVISWYYYVRAPWYFVERKRAFPDLPLPNPNWLRKVGSVSRVNQALFVLTLILYDEDLTRPLPFRTAPLRSLTFHHSLSV